MEPIPIPQHLIFTVTGVNDAPVADPETGAVNEDATLNVTDGTSDVLHGDADADDSASLQLQLILIHQPQIKVVEVHHQELEIVVLHERIPLYVIMVH